MKNGFNLVVPCLAVALAAGCSAGRVSQLQKTVDSQQQYTQELMTISDRNASAINEIAGEVAGMDRRLSALEASINTSMTDDSASLQEIRENLAFLNDQLARIDKSVQTTSRPVERPQGATVFKPGGFDVNTSYDAALADYRDGKFETAVSGFKEVLTVAPSSSLADNAQYWIGECYDAMGNYEQALASFNKVFDYPESNKLPDAHVKSAIIYNKMGQSDLAREEYRAVMNAYPGTDAAAVASARLAELGQ